MEREWRQSISRFKNKKGYYVYEGDIVRLNKKVWFIDMLTEDKAWLVRFKNNQFNPGILEHCTADIAILTPMDRSSNFVKFLKGVYCSYAVNMKGHAPRILDGIAGKWDFVRTFHFKQLQDLTLCWIENYSVFSPYCYISTRDKETCEPKHYIVANKRLLTT